MSMTALRDRTQQKRTLLLIADMPEDRAMIRHSLIADADYGYTLLEAETGAEGLHLWHQHKPDCVLLDYQLPDTDGLRLLAALNPDPLKPAVPVILMTGAGNESLAAQALNRGAQDYLVKGRSTPAEIHLAIRQAMEIFALRHSHKQAEDSLRESEKLLRSTLDSLLPSVAILDHEGTILDVNRAWKQFAEENGSRMSRDGIGINYLDVVRRATADGEQNTQQMLEGIQAVLTGRHTQFVGEYPCHSPTQQQWFMLSVNPLDTAHGGAVVSHINITERKHTEDQLRIVAARTEVAQEAARASLYEYMPQTNTMVRNATWVQISNSEPKLT